jgi:hypothetical protein
MPSDLRAAHVALDKSVLATFGLKTDSSDAKVLEVLFDKYSLAVDGLLYKSPKSKAKK